jgi:hypothetical protein
MDAMYNKTAKVFMWFGGFKSEAQHPLQWIEAEG